MIGFPVVTARAFHKSLSSGIRFGINGRGICGLFGDISQRDVGGIGGFKTILQHNQHLKAIASV